MDRPRRIGVVGGLSSESTIVYYRALVSGYREKTGGREDYPEIVVYSLCFDCFRSAVRSGDVERAIGMLHRALVALSSAGADFAVIAANTPHIYYDRLIAVSPIPVLSIVDAVVSVVSERGSRVVGVLGTRKTIEEGLYEKPLRSKGIEVVYPPEPLLEKANRVIFGELAVGRVTAKAKRLLVEAVEAFRSAGADSVLLACTELSLLVEKPETVISGIRVYDSARIHAMAALEYSLRGAIP